MSNQATKMKLYTFVKWNCWHAWILMFPLPFKSWKTISGWVENNSKDST